MNSVASWSQQYIYDGFGNMKQKTGTGLAQLHSFNISMNSATNNGGTTSASQYDMDDRMLGPEYAPDDKRLTSAAAGGKTNVFFWLGSMRVATYQVWSVHSEQNGWQTLTQVKKEDLYLAGRRVEPADRLGSNLTSGLKLLPYGEELQPPNVDNDRTKFATYHRDVDGLDYADQRYYLPGTGRFATGDPYLASGGAGEPGSWNRYAYVEGDPINYSDPSGEIRILSGEGGVYRWPIPFVIFGLGKIFGSIFGGGVDPTITIWRKNPGAQAAIWDRSIREAESRGEEQELRFIKHVIVKDDCYETNRANPKNHLCSS